MTDLPESLVELARRYGVATEYDDWTGRHVTVAESTLVAVLDALGVAAATEDDAPPRWPSTITITGHARCRP